jgi:hypothetical protein
MTLIKRLKTNSTRTPGFKVLRTIDPLEPFGKVLDPVSGIEYESLDAATPKGWQEQFRCEYIPGARRAKGYRAHVEMFPHEVVIVDTGRCRVIPFGKTTQAGDVGTATCVPAWVTYV